MKYFLLLTTVILLLASCSEDSEYPFEQSPYVEFEDLAFIDSEQIVDTLKLSFTVWDSDGDLGLEDVRNLNHPYHEYNVITDSQGEPVRLRNEVIPPFYSSPVNVPRWFTLI